MAWGGEEEVFVMWVYLWWGGVVYPEVGVVYLWGGVVCLWGCEVIRFGGMFEIVLRYALVLMFLMLKYKN